MEDKNFKEEQIRDQGPGIKQATWLVEKTSLEVQILGNSPNVGASDPITGATACLRGSLGPKDQPKQIGWALTPPPISCA